MEVATTIRIEVQEIEEVGEWLAHIRESGHGL